MEAALSVSSAAIPGEPTLLLVDDDEAFRTALGHAFERRGFAVTIAEDARRAEEAARQQVFEYALVDVRMPGASGIELCAALRRIDEETRIVVLTGYGTIANAVEAMRAGAADYLTKPVDAAACERALLGRGQVREVRGSLGDEEDVPSLDRVEYEYLQRVLADCGGNVSEAARRLRMHRRSLQRKITRQPPKR
jgi:two-component system, response regulator RegA